MLSCGEKSSEFNSVLMIPLCVIATHPSVHDIAGSKALPTNMIEQTDIMDIFNF